jgi:hypothetical protein
MATDTLDSTIHRAFAPIPPPLPEGSAPVLREHRQATREVRSDYWYILPDGAPTENRFYRTKIFRLIHDDNTQDYVQLNAQNDGISGSTVVLQGRIRGDFMKQWTTLTAPEDVDRVAGQLLRKYLAILNGKQRHGSDGTVE